MKARELIKELTEIVKNLEDFEDPEVAIVVDPISDPDFLMSVTNTKYVPANKSFLKAVNAHILLEAKDA
jgi:hypothetical protein